jgi:hypothetical protein
MKIPSTELMCLTDFGAFLGWFGVWWHLRRWPHPLLFPYCVLCFAFWRLWEGVLLCHAAGTIPSWVHTGDLYLRAVVALMGAYYFTWVKEHYRILFSQVPKPTSWWDSLWMNP